MAEKLRLLAETAIIKASVQFVVIVGLVDAEVPTAVQGLRIGARAQTQLLALSICQLIDRKDFAVCTYANRSAANVVRMTRNHTLPAGTQPASCQLPGRFTAYPACRTEAGRPLTIIVTFVALEAYAA
jgi:hypothetical protein